MSVAKAAMPPPALRFLAVAAANTLIHAGYAMLWVGTACNAFMVVARRAWGEGSAVLSAATTVALYALVGSGFLLPFSLMLAAALSMASDSESSSNNTDVEQHTKEPAVRLRGPCQILRNMLKDSAVVGVLLTLPFVLLIVAGVLVKGISPAKESERERVGSILMDVGIVGFSTLQCFIVLPIAILRTWRMIY